MKSFIKGSFVLLLVLTAAAAFAQDSVTPSIEVQDQSISVTGSGDTSSGIVNIDKVVSDGAGWVVIHADNNGQPGEVIGHTAVESGTSENVQVEVDASKATGTLYAMLHTDAGDSGSYEFPGPDAPVRVDGNVVVKPFKVQM